MILLLTLTMFSGCGEKSLTQEEAYKIYYGTIEKFVPEIMSEPQECDVEITTRDEVTFLTENFTRNSYTKIQSQNADGELQYYLLNEFPEAEKMDFFSIDNDKFYIISSAKLNEKGTLVERNIKKVAAAAAHNITIVTAVIYILFLFLFSIFFLFVGFYT